MRAMRASAPTKTFALSELGSATWARPGRLRPRGHAIRLGTDRDLPARAYQRSTYGPSSAPSAPVVKMPSEYHSATKAGETSVQCSA